ncbi:MAG: hypothetical protein AB7R40_22250 [Nitrospiraceae bacterium]
MGQDEIEALVCWVRETMPALMKSGEPWQVVLHGGRGGDVIAEVNRKQAVLPPRKEKAKASVSSNGHLR